MNVVIRKMVRGAWLLAALTLGVGPASAQDRLIQEAKDSATKATLRLYRTSGGPRLDVDTPALQLRKQMIGNKVVTSLRGGGQSLIIEFDGQTFSVASGASKASTPRHDQAGFERVRQLVVNSPLTKRATTLIARIGFGESSPIQPMLLTTRMFLLSLANDQSGVREMSDWVRHARTRLAVVKTAAGQKSPTECWNAYAKEAIEAWIEYEQCMKDAPWWNLLAEAGCTLIYDMRALGAFSWWLDCVKLTNFMG